jgi:uncharacterized membrane protein
MLACSQRHGWRQRRCKPQRHGTAIDLLARDHCTAVSHAQHDGNFGQQLHRRRQDLLRRTARWDLHDHRQRAEELQRVLNLSKNAKRSQGQAEADHAPADYFVAWLTVVFLAVLGFAVGVAVVYWILFRDQPIETDRAALGQLGDYFGGLVNPVVGLVTVFFVLLSLSIQRKELRATVEEMKVSNESAMRMSFEQSLFSWLGNYQSLVNAVENEAGRGRRALAQWYHLWFEDVQAWFGFPGHVLSSEEVAKRKFVIASQCSKLPNSEHAAERAVTAFFAARKSYMQVFAAQRFQLDAVLRTIYRLFQWIDESSLSGRQKWHYAALVRAQLSWVEMAYLLYNATSLEGAEFAKYVNRYALLDNLAGDTDQLIKVLRSGVIPATLFNEVDPSFHWPLEPSAFSSSLAKTALFAPGVDG